MVKVDVKLFRELQELQELALSMQSLVLRITTKHGVFCDTCGETEPVSGFYPLGVIGPGRVSAYTCNDCEAKQRKAVQSKEKEEL